MDKGRRIRNTFMYLIQEFVSYPNVKYFIIFFLVLWSRSILITIFCISIIHVKYIIRTFLLMTSSELIGPGSCISSTWNSSVPKKLVYNRYGLVGDFKSNVGVYIDGIRCLCFLCLLSFRTCVWSFWLCVNKLHSLQ